MELFEEQVKDILWAEKALVKAIPKMITLVTSLTEEKAADQKNSEGALQGVNMEAATQQS